MSKNNNSIKTVTYEQFEGMLNILSDDQYYALESAGIIDCFKNYEKSITRVMKKLDYIAVKRLIGQYVNQSKIKISDDIDFIVDYKTILHKPCYSKNFVDIMVLSLNQNNMHVVYDIIDDGLAAANCHNEVARSLLAYASVNEDTNIIKRLAINGGNIDQIDEKNITPLISAVARNSWALAKCFAECGANVNVEYLGKSMLKYALIHHRTDVIECFVKYGANISEQDAVTSSSLLIFAIQDVDYLSVKCLVDSGIDLNLRDYQGKTALIYACEKGYYDIVKYLVDHDALLDAKDNYESVALIYAIQRGHYDVAKYLIMHKAAVNIKCFVGGTPLMSAAYNGHLDIVKLLIEYGADLDLRDDSGRTAFMNAFTNKKSFSLDVVKYFIEQDKSVMYVRAEWYQTPLLYAALCGNFEAVKFLIDNGAVIEDVDSNGVTLLMYAVWGGNLDIIKYLIERGVMLDAVDQNGMTALMHAVDDKPLGIDIVQLLVNYGANTHLRDKQGDDILKTTAKNGNLDIVKFLIENEKDAAEKKESCFSALMCACVNGHLSIVKYLIENKFDMLKCTLEGITPLKYASRAGHLDIVKYLVEQDVDVSAHNNDNITALIVAELCHNTDVAAFLRGVIGEV